MRRLLSLVIASAACLAICAAPAKAAQITVTPWLAPNAFGSPSYNAAVANNNYALMNGLSTYGAAGPTQYNANSNVTSAQVVVTGFPSWMGLADPGTVFGPAYANELGNRMHFGVSIFGSGSQFSISQLGFSATSTDPFNALAFAFGPGAFNYNAGYVGVQFGGNGVFDNGAGDDVLITGGANTQLVDALFGRGPGNSFAAYCPGCTVAQQQAQIDLTAAYPGSDFSFTGTYALGADTGSGTFNVQAVPEPTTWAMMMLGFAGVAGYGAYKRRKSADSNLAFAPA